jgi:alkylation response protein AidB-like acyl-CoA dehydrogenase
LVIEALAGGCLTSTFIWQQHAGPASATSHCEGEAHRYAPGLARGDIRGGVAFAHLLRQGPPVLRAEPCADGWQISGTAPYITGWGDVDIVLIAARWQDSIIWGIVPGIESATMSARMLELAAVNSTSTAVITFDQHIITSDDITSVVPFDTWLENYRMGLRANGSLALGVTGRCLSLLGPSDLDHEYVTARERLDTATVDELPAARANASDLCMRAATMLVAASGGGAVALSHHAQLLARQAMFLLVQSQTREIRSHQLARTF